MGGLHSEDWLSNQVIGMSVDLSRVPKTKNGTIKKILAAGVANAQSVIKGEIIATGKDAFGESDELLAFEILRASDVDASALREAGRVHSQLERVFRDDLTEISQPDYLSCLALGFYGFIMQNYDDEDFRYLYRYSLSASMKHEPVMR
ncbi:MAG: hypothetical protein ACFE8Z_05700, partial [Candidatus Hermodarchaeota archaeon]